MWSATEQKPYARTCAQTARISRRKSLSRHLLKLITISIAAVAGCNGGSGTAGGRWFTPTAHGKERWTIRCIRYSAAELPDHANHCRRLADMLRQVEGLKADNVRVVSDATGSTIYYGQYTKVASSEAGDLSFPPELRTDINAIRHLSLNRYMPFLLAVPELIESGTSAGLHRCHVSNATGKYTLQVAVFYNTATFSERKTAAEQYVQLLRERGLAAYYAHEPARSFVFVGDFGDGDVIPADSGPRYGPAVEQLRTRNDGEFKYMTENGHLLKTRGPDGRMRPPPTFLVEVPRGSSQTGWSR